MLGPRDTVPHFEVTSIRGTAVRYATLWQRKNLVLVTLPPDNPPGLADYLNQLSSVTRDFGELNTELVMTRDVIAGIEPGVVIADRWGEICFGVAAPHPADFPAPDDLLEWARYLQQQCPECQGEAR